MKTSNNRRIAYLAVAASLILLFGLVPYLGYFPIGPLSITIMPLLVMIIAFLLGWQSALLAACLFGLTAWLTALRSASPEAILFQRFDLAVLTRVVWGCLLAIAVKIIIKLPDWQFRWATLIGAPILNLVHATIVLSYLFIVVGSDDLAQLVLLIVSSNSLLETALAFLVAIIVMPLRKVVKRKGLI